MSAFTPGPWIVEWHQWDRHDSLWVVPEDPSATVICEVVPRGGEYVNEFSPEDHANARLLAAAPNLLEACKVALPGLESEGFWAAEVVKDAITKAEG